MNHCIPNHSETFLRFPHAPRFRPKHLELAHRPDLGPHPLPSPPPNLGWHRRSWPASLEKTATLRTRSKARIGHDTLTRSRQLLLARPSRAPGDAPRIWDQYLRGGKTRWTKRRNPHLRRRTGGVAAALGFVGGSSRGRQRRGANPSEEAAKSPANRRRRRRSLGRMDFSRDGPKHYDGPKGSQPLNTIQNNYGPFWISFLDENSSSSNVGLTQPSSARRARATAHDACAL